MDPSPRRWLRKDEYGNRQPPPGWLFGVTVALIAVVAVALTAVALAQR
jgi:hypothetical protein